MNRYIPLILTGVLLNAVAQLCIKQGMRIIGRFDFALEQIIPVGLKTAVNPYIFSGLVCYVVSVVVWIMVLSRVDVSYAYPLLSIGYIVTAVVARIFFGEALGFNRCAGIFVICIGVYLITRSA